jgi:hypothetical protein
MLSFLKPEELLADSLFYVYEYEKDTNMAATPASQNQFKVVNVSTVPHRSPFRYPGGKTWLVPRVRDWLKSITAL